MKEPRSIRLNATHRKDIIDAVMSEWEKQTPAPTTSSHLSLLTLVAEEFKNHSAYKRTERMVSLLTAEDLKHITQEQSIGVRVEDSSGNHKRDLCFGIPLSIAKSLNMVTLPITSIHTTDLLESECKPEDRWGERYGNTYVNCASFAVRGSIMIVLQDDSPEMVAIEDGRKALHLWSQERDQLRRETSDLLEQYNTTKQVRDSWPELVNYLPAHIADPERAVTLPVLATSRLSERLGIK